MCVARMSGKRSRARFTGPAAPRRARPSRLLVAAHDAQAGRLERRRTSVSRSTKMPDARSRRRCRRRARTQPRQLGGEVTSRLRRGWRARGRTARPRPAAMPCRARTRRATRCGARWRRVASTAIGSVSMAAHARAAPSSAAVTARMPEPAPDVEDRGPSTRPSSAQRSTPARHSRVVGCSPVPKAMPGSSASDDVVRCRARCRARSAG